MPALRPSWFYVDLNIIELILCNSYVTKIYGDAFNTPPFVRLRVLIISRVPIKKISQGAFNGLMNLREIRLDHVQLTNFEPFTLAPAPNLNKFTLENCGTNEFDLKNLLGTAPMLHLNYVTIERCNLKNTITKTTFSGLHNILNLRLVSNKITQIESNAFDVAFQNLQSLELGMNRLKTLPPNFFAARKKQNILLDLNNNPWHCDCQLEELQKLIQLNNGLKFSSVICKSPPELAGQLLGSCPPLCDNKASAIEKWLETQSEGDGVKIDEPKNEPHFGYYDADEYEVDVEVDDLNGHDNDHASDFESEIEAEIRDDDSDGDDGGYVDDESEFEDENSYVDNKSVIEQVISKERVTVQCERPQLGKTMVKLIKPLGGILSIRIEDGNLYLTAGNLSKHLILIGFEQLVEPNGAPTCLGIFEGGNEHVEIEFELKPNNIYRFCRMIKDFAITELLECVLYHSKGTTEVQDLWLTTQIRPVILSVGILFAVFAIFMGILLAKVLTLIFPELIRCQQVVVEKTQKTMQEQLAIDRLR